MSRQVTSPQLVGAAVPAPLTTRSAAWRRVRVAFTAAAVLLAMLAAAAWQIPPWLDWSRYRSAIATMAAGELGRPVTIGGGVQLSLLPQAVLTAGDVTLSDPGHGLSAHLRALRLELALWPLLRGKLVPRDLVLDNPVITLPWPLLAGPSPVLPAPGLRAHVAPGFAARMEDGTIVLGSLSLAGINASLHAEADTGAMAADGSARLAGRLWRFSALVGDTAANGASALDLAISPQSTRADNAHGRFRGRILTSGTLEGAAGFAGSDLSAFLTAPASAWRADGWVTATADRMIWSALHLKIGTTNADGRAMLSLAPTLRLDATLAGNTVELADWSALLRASPTLPVEAHLDLRAAAGTAATIPFRDLHAALSILGNTTRVAAASVRLPGNAELTLSGDLTRDAAGQARFTGPAELVAPDLRATLSLAQSGSPSVLQRARLAGQLHMRNSAITVTALTGTLDDTAIAGEMNASSSPRRLGLVLATDRLKLDSWAEFARDQLNPAFPQSGDFDVAITAKTAPLAGVILTDLTLSGHLNPHGLALRQLDAHISGGHLQIAGTLGADLSLSSAKLNLDAASGTSLYAALPPAWQAFPALWRGETNLTIAAAGPPHAIATQVRADFGDLRAEADATLDLPARAASATITLRHPGAPRLLQDLGFPGTERWLDHGAVALLARAQSHAGHVTIQNFSLSAAALQLQGGLDFDAQPAAPTLTGQLTATSLPLPDFVWPVSQSPTLADLPPWLARWRADLHLDASEIFTGLHRTATQAHADVALADGVLHLADVSANLAGGSVGGELALDTSQNPPLLAVQGTLANAHLKGPFTAAPVDIETGMFSGWLDMTATGETSPALLATVAGTMAVTLQDTQIDGFDLPRLTHLLKTRGAKLRAGLKAAQTTGTTPALSGSGTAKLDHGSASIEAIDLTSQAGSAAISGMADLSTRTATLLLKLIPAVTNPPLLTRRLALSWATSQASEEPGGEPPPGPRH